MRHNCYRSQLRARQGPPGLLHPDCTDMFAAASPLVEGMPERGAAYLDSSEELDERRGHPCRKQPRVCSAAHHAAASLLIAR